MTQDLGILVGVTARHENTDALRFAIETAATWRCPITLVHVGHLVAPSSVTHLDEWDQGSYTTVSEVGEELDALSDHAATIGIAVRHGDPGIALGRLTSAARLLVLQHRDRSRMHRAVTGSTVIAAAAHASCPVVAVPPANPSTAHGVVVVGLHHDGGPPAVLEAAFREAGRRRSTLVMVHARPAIPAYEALADRGTGWRRDCEVRLESAAWRAARRHPAVSARTVVTRDWPDEVLLGLSSCSDVLVVGRHGHRGPAGFRLGSLARAAVGQAACPVMVVPV